MPPRTNVTCDTASGGTAGNASIEDGFGTSPDLRRCNMSYCSRCNKEDMNTAEAIRYDIHMSIYSLDFGTAVGNDFHDLQLSHL